MTIDELWRMYDQAAASANTDRDPNKDLRSAILAIIRRRDE
jgi:hypothetical protein